MIICKNCNQKNNTTARFCQNCGLELFFKEKSNNIKNLYFIIWTFIISITFFVLNNIINKDGDLKVQIIIDIVFALGTIILCLLKSKSILRIITNFHISFRILLIQSIILIGFAFFVTVLADKINLLIHQEEYSYYLLYINTPYPLLFCILSISVYPAIFEELLFRGFLFEHSIKISNLKNSILITTIAFALLHLSIISLLWIIPIGLYFGYRRAKHRSIWYGVFGHFIYNLTIVLIDYYQIENSFYY